MSDILDKSQPKQEISKLLNTLKTERLKYFKKKILCEALKNCQLSNELKEKRDQVLMGHKFDKLTELQTCTLGTNNTNLLGLSYQDSPDFSYNETERIKKSVELNLITSRKELREALQQINDPKLSLNPSTINQRQRISQELIENLNLQRDSYLQNLLTLPQVLKNMRKIKTENVSPVCNLKYTDLELKMKMYDLRTEILNVRIKEKIFLETDKSMEAYQLAFEDLKTSQKSYKKDIDELLLLKEKYQQVQCVEFEQILKSYIQYKKALTGLKNLYVDLK